MATQEKLSFSESPLSVKQRLKLRTLVNFSILVAVFVPIVVLSVALTWPHFWMAWIIDAAVIALLLYFFRMFLDKRAIWLRCPHCSKMIATNTPWMCGACQAKNEHVDDFSFANRCEACEVEPKAYQCHHENCGKLIFLTPDELVRNYAFCINPPTIPTEDEMEHSNFERKKRRAEYRLHLARLNTEVEKAEQGEKEIKRKSLTPQEKIEEHRANRRSKTIVATEIYRNERKANAEKYKDDEEMLKLVNEDLEDWYKSGDWERLI